MTTRTNYKHPPPGFMSRAEDAARMAEKAERMREPDAGPVTAEEAMEIAQRFIDGHFGNAGKEGPRISIPADPMRDDDIRLVAFIEQSAAEIERLREDLDQKARAGAGVAFDLKELQDERDELRTKLDTAERESCAAIQKLIAERDAAVAERDHLRERVAEADFALDHVTAEAARIRRELEALRDALANGPAPHRAPKGWAVDRIDAILASPATTETGGGS